MPCIIDMQPHPFHVGDELPRPYILRMREKIAEEHASDPVRQGYELAKFDRKYGLKAVGELK